MNTKELSSSLREVVSAIHKTLRKQSFPSQVYSMTEMETIGHLMRNGQLLPSELASLTRVKTQSMSQILNKLKEHRVISRVPSKTDKRKVYISLTASGKKMIHKTIDERDEWLKKKMDSKLSGKEKELLEKSLPILHALIQD